MSVHGPVRGLNPRFGVGVASSVPDRPRPRGHIEWLPSGSARVKAYGGVDQVSGKEVLIRETVRAKPTRRQTEREAQKALTRLLNQVDGWLDVIDVERTTRTGYIGKIENT